MTTSPDELTTLAHTAIRGVLNQGGASIAPPPYQDGAPVCAYRSPSGRRCVIGHILPDEYYAPRFERHNIQALVLHAREFLPAYLVDHAEFFQELQRAHDDAWHNFHTYGEAFLPNFSTFAAHTLLRWGIPLPEELLPFTTTTPKQRHELSKD